MDQNAFFTYRDKVAMTLTNRLIEALEKDQVTEEDGALIAGYLQDRLNQITTDEELTLLLTEMAEKWSIFEQLFIPSGDIPKASTAPQEPPNTLAQEQALQAEDEIQMNKVEEALSAIQQSAPQQQPEGGTQ